VPITQLRSHTNGPDWLWFGFLARMHLTMFSAKLKTGKSTALAYLMRALQTGTPFLGHGTQACRTLVVSEEPSVKWEERRDRLQLGDALELMCRPMRAKPTLLEWIGFLTFLQSRVKGKYDLVVFDTIASFAPWRDENDSAEVEATIRPLSLLMEDAGAAVMLVHHIGKSDGREGRAARGSTALSASADILLELRPHTLSDISNRRRVLTGIGRYDETPGRVVAELAPDGSNYVVVAGRGEEAAGELREDVLGRLPAGPPGVTADEMHGRLPTTSRPGLAAVRQSLQQGYENGVWSRSGSGKKGEPFRFWQRASDAVLPSHCALESETESG
jgi:hypothetical protein